MASLASRVAAGVLLQFLAIVVAGGCYCLVVGGCWYPLLTHRQAEGLVGEDQDAFADITWERYHQQQRQHLHVEAQGCAAHVFEDR